jgi:hypothetical protein
VEEELDWEELDNEDFASWVVGMVLDDDPYDKHWIPEWLQRKREKQKAGRHVSTCFQNLQFQEILT